MELTHGGDVLGFEARYGRPPLDFSVNTNPLGMPAAAREAAARSIEQAGAYPDPLCRRLCAALARHEPIPEQYILCGNGAADLIFRLCFALKPKRALLPAPSFAEYEQALRAAGCAVAYHPLRREDDFTLTGSVLPAITPQTDILFLCEPGNPTGQLTPPALLRQVAARCAETGTLLVVDECFGGFLQQPQAHTMAPLLPVMPNLLVLKAFTKLYAMAGLRLGYCLCSDAALLGRMRAAGQPWAVSVVAQAAGEAALAADGYLQETRRLIGQERAYLQEQLAALGLRVYGSQANYLFFYTAAPDFFEGMARQGVLLRNCANYQGLQPGYFRASVQLRAQNDRLVAAAKKVLNAAEG